ncbi:MAG: hypothetical protein WA395_09005, partial [Nitrososphaeraceae archaeon]
MAPSSLNINKFAFAQQNPVLPNYRGDHRAFEPSKMLDNQANLTSSEIQSKSLVHYQPISPVSHYYTGNSNEASTNGFPRSITNTFNSTNPSSLVQPVSLTHYQPITPSGSGGPISNTGNIFSGGQESSLAGDSHHSSNDNSHSSNDNSHDGGSHSGSSHKSSSNHNNNDHAGRTSHHSSDHSSSHHHGASASAGDGGASASAGDGGASASAGDG